MITIAVFFLLTVNWNLTSFDEYRLFSYTADNVYTKLNAASNNYFGTKVSKEDIQKMINDMESASDKYGSILLTSGEYTLDLSIQYVEGTDFRIVKYRVLTTKLYNEYQGA